MSSTETGFHKTDNLYEDQFGYSRAVRRGNQIFVSGTTSLSPAPPHLIRFLGDAKGQTICALNESLAAIEKLGGLVGDVVRVKLFVKRQEDTDAVGEAMKQVLEGKAQWAATMIVGCAFVNEHMLVEVELDAVVLEG